MSNLKFPYSGPLQPANASAIILTNEDGFYLMQRRDDKPGIFYPGFLGLFGGACEEGENYMETAIRELEEEIGLSLNDRIEFLSQTTLGFEPLGHDRIERVFFHGILSTKEIESIQLGEGQGFELIDGKQLLKFERIVPYDAFAIWVHLNAKYQKKI